MLRYDLLPPSISGAQEKRATFGSQPCPVHRVPNNDKLFWIQTAYAWPLPVFFL